VPFDIIFCGDSIVELEKLKDKVIDIVITDPPYGVNYTSNWSQDLTRPSKQSILNDTLEDACNLLDKVCDILSRKTKDDAHIYIFTRWDIYPIFKSIVDKYFTVKSLLVWDTCSHGMGDLTQSWGCQTEFIIFAVKGNKKLVHRSPNLLTHNKVTAKGNIHSTQKPVKLIRDLIDASAVDGDVICDPFMGSGSTIKAVIERGNLHYIGYELNKNIFQKAEIFINKSKTSRLW